jgi:hypothetical protein
MVKTMNTLILQLPAEGEAIDAFLARVEGTSGEILVLFGVHERTLRADPALLESVLTRLAPLGTRLRLATGGQWFARAARAKGLRVVDRTADLRRLLQDHPQLPEAMRAFSPRLWRRELRSHLQAMGLLSLPKVRIWSLIVLSAAVFGFVAFRLLPSAEIRVQPREDVVTHAANIFLVQTGATVTDLPPRVRSVPLVPVRVRIDRTTTFDRVSKQFIGRSATVDMTVINRSEEPFDIRSDSRLANQAGMVFRTLERVSVAPGKEQTVPAVADDVDLYNEIIGERGNVPAGLQWYFPGLDPADRELVFAENRAAAAGGETAFRTVLQQEDLRVAEAQLREELMRQANQLVDERLELQNLEQPGRVMARLYYEELTKITYTGFVLPTEFLGEAVTSVPVTGTLLYESYAYDQQEVLEFLQTELRGHVEDGRELLPDSAGLDRMVAHVISYDDDLRWIKLTVDLSGTQRFVLDPLTPAGARFARAVREAVKGALPEDARRVVGNMPEVHRIEVALWPPWSKRLPSIPYHIRVSVMNP